MIAVNNTIITSALAPRRVDRLPARLAISRALMTANERGGARAERGEHQLALWRRRGVKGGADRDERQPEEPEVS